MRLIWKISLTIGVALATPVLSSAATPELRFEERAITVAQVTPGGQVLLCGLAREPLAGTPIRLGRVSRTVIVSDADGDGTVRHDLEAPIPHQGMWVAIDMTTGDYAGATSPGYERPPLGLTADVAKNDNNGQLRKMQWAMPEMHACLVRPGDGAWKLYAARATEADESGPEEPLRIDIGRFKQIGTPGDAPPNFRPGDVLVIFDPSSMKFGVIEVGR